MSHLLWELTKNYNSYLVKRNGVEFSRDPNNLTNRNLYSSSGIAHQDSLSLTAQKAGAKDKTTNPVFYHLRFQTRQRWQQAARKVAANKAKGKVTSTVNANRRNNNVSEHLPVKGLHTASRIIQRRFANRRRDLKRLALQRLAKVHRAAVVRKAAASK